MTAGPCHFCDEETGERFGGMWLCSDCRPDDDADSGEDQRPRAARLDGYAEASFASDGLARS